MLGTENCWKWFWPFVNGGPGWKHPSAGSTFLSWVEYAHNSLSSSATGMLPFMALLGFQPPLFPTQEEEVAVPSVQAHLRRCHCALLVCSTAHTRQTTDQHRTLTPVFKLRQKVGLSSRDLPFQVDCMKLAPRLVGSYELERIVNSAAIWLKLLAALRVKPLFHVSLLKPVVFSPLLSGTESLSLMTDLALFV